MKSRSRSWPTIRRPTRSGSKFNETGPQRGWRSPVKSASELISMVKMLSECVVPHIKGIRLQCEARRNESDFVVMRSIGARRILVQLARLRRNKHPKIAWREVTNLIACSIQVQARSVRAERWTHFGSESRTEKTLAGLAGQARCSKGALLPFPINYDQGLQ